jgi:5-methylcytosine-specific restriction endonuclease McrA
LSIAVAVKHMIAAGMSPEAIVAAVAEMEAAAQPVRSNGAVRQERYRARRLPAREWEPLRLKVFARDGFRCTYCGDAEGPFECDHVVPTSRGGCNDETNLTTACKPCNASKKDKLVEEWLV